MRLHPWISARLSKGIVLALALAFSGELIALAHEDGSFRVAAQTQKELEATYFCVRWPRLCSKQKLPCSQTTENPPSIRS